MAALTRVLQKIFGRTGDTDQFGKVGSDSAGTPTVTKDLDEIQSLSQFEAGLFSITANLANPPRGEDFNALLYLITSQLKYLFQSGVPEWIATENYYANKSIVIGSDGNLYKSKTGTDVSPNINHNPVGDTTNWAIVWDITNDGSGSGLDADLVRGTTPGTRGLQYLAAAAVANIASLILADLKTVDGSGSGLDTDTVRGTTPGTRGLQYLAAASVSNIAALILSDLKTVDGSGSDLDADLLDGVQGSAYAKVNTATSSTETDLPVGSYVLMNSGSSISRNQSSTVYFNPLGVNYTYTSADVALAGTWRASGAVRYDTDTNTTYITLMRRVA